MGRIAALRGMGERMSASVIAWLSASAETPGMLPGVPSEDALRDRGEDVPPAQADYAAPDLRETGPEHSDVAEAIAEGRTEEGSMSAAEGTAISLDIEFPEIGLPDVQAPGSDPDLWLYRKRTVGLLRRYLRLSIEVGRMPSLLGREFFRSRVTAYKASTFEDTVIFVHDVERSLEQLSEFDKQLIAKIVLQEYSQREAGRLLGCGRRHAARCYPEALDRVTEILLRRGLLTRLPCPKPDPGKSCQGGKTGEFFVSDSEQAKNKY